MPGVIGRAAATLVPSELAGGLVGVACDGVVDNVEGSGALVSDEEWLAASWSATMAARVSAAPRSTAVIRRPERGRDGAVLGGGLGAGRGRVGC